MKSALIQSVVRALPSRVTRKVDEAIQSLKLEDSIETDKVFKGEVTASQEVAPENEAEIVSRLIQDFKLAKRNQSAAARVYHPAPGWERLLASQWALYYKVIESEDVHALAKLLRNFFRNEGISGFWGETNMFEGFANMTPRSRLRRQNIMLEQYKVWREAFPTTPLEELRAPRIGNPWGYDFDGNLVYEPGFEYHLQAEYFKTLLPENQTAVILEIGGGFGGLAYQILRRGPKVKYIGIDLPENILLQTYYLKSAFPKSRFLTYNGGDTFHFNKEVLSEVDIVLLPNFLLSSIPTGSVHLAANIRSLSEMSAETIANYLGEIERIYPMFFFHENISSARRDSWFGIPSSEFPKMDAYKLVASSESRWPKYKRNSTYPCRENLYMTRRLFQTGNFKVQ